MSTTSVDDCTEDVLVVSSGCLEVGIINLNVTLESDEILVAELVRTQFALVRSIFSKMGIIFLFGFDLEVGLSLSKTTVESRKNS